MNRLDLRQDVEDQPDLRVVRDMTKPDTGTGDDADVPDEDLAEPGESDLAGVDSTVVGPVTDSDIRDVQMGVVPTGAVAKISGVVTGVDPKTNFFFVQEPTGTPEWSGIAVYLGATTTLTKPAVGDTVTLQGTVKEFKTSGAPLTRTNIEDVTSLEIGAKVALPAPAVIAMPSGLNVEATAEPYEGVLIKVESPSCTKAPDSFKEFQITGTVFVDDRLYDYSANSPVVGDNFQFVQGLFDYNNGHYKILPRELADMPKAEAPLNLTSLTPATVSVEELKSTNLTVTLSRNVTSPTTVSVTSSAPTVANPASPTVTVATGQKTATITVNALVHSATPVTITASLTGSTPPTRTASITVTEKAVVPTDDFLSPATITLQANTGTLTAADRSGLLQITLPAPAGTGGQLVLLESSNPTALAVASEVRIPEGKTKGGFRVRADSATATTATITATDGTAIGTITVNIALTSPSPVAGTSKELVINELLYDPDDDASCNGAQSAEGDEFVELANASNHSLDLFDVALWDQQAYASSSAAPVFKFTTHVILGPGEAFLVFGKETSKTTVAKPAWCTATPVATATTIGDARFLVSSEGFLLGNSGDQMNVTLGTAAADKTGKLLDKLTYANNAAENVSLERQPQVGQTSTFVRHALATDANAWSTTPGFLASGQRFSLADPTP